ncbi:hypothetical protein [Alteromonas mediterranea]|jgi:hypothetical protein|uniref:hypothetical protein n=1 Tax=Alteromonas mediterranea TaxID=314275 RepID=UPI0032B18648|tara:strand:+ start:1301 stop:1681 length:381 start_codon:yes stop_codon:yes gene_type:complete
MNILGGLFGAVTNLGSTWLKNKAAEKQAKHEAKMNVIQNDADWEAKMADASASSWKDEFFSLVLSTPLFFIGYAIVVDDMTIIHRVEQAFAALNNLPDWYQYLLFIAVSASFGIKGADKVMNMRKK